MHKKDLLLPALNKLREFIIPELDMVNNLIISSVDSYAELIPTITNYLTAAGGKRLRPMLTLAVGKILNIKGDAHIKLATAVEYLHTATLLHDDVIDNSDLRRGRKTANNVWGNKASILVGDYLLSQSFKLMVETKSLNALDMLANTASKITESEIWQLELIKKIDMSVADYIKLIQGKTAILFAASCAASAITMNLPDKIINSLYAYGLNFGICFQIIDDLLDYFSNSEDFGKSLGNDLAEGKITLPLILTYQAASNDDRDIIHKIVNSDTHTPQEFDQIFNLFTKYSAKNNTLNVALNYAQTGANCLSDIANFYNIQLLKDVILEQSTRIS